MARLRAVPGSGSPAEPEAVALLAVEAPAAPVEDEVPLAWFGCDDRVVGSLVRGHVLSVLNSWAVDSDSMADAMVLVSELVANVCDHTPSGTLGVRVRVGAQRIVVAVVEGTLSGAPSDARLVPGPADTADGFRTLHDRGRGLRILDAVAAEWGFVRTAGVTTTWFALAAAAPGARAHVPEIRRF